MLKPALFPQFRRDRRFESDDVPSLLSRHKARAGCRHYLDLFWRECELLAIDCKAERACLIEQFGRLTNTARIKCPECRQDFLHQWPVLWTQYFRLRLQCVI